MATAVPIHDGWTELHKEYGERGLVLVLGAGVSIGCGLPSWRELLRRLAIRSFPPNGAALFDELSHAGFGFPAIAGILENQWDSREDFSRIIQQELYRGFPFFPTGVNPENRAEFLQYVQERNPTLRAVAALCAETDDRTGAFVRNPRIHSVLNTNLDSTLRSYSYWRHSGDAPRSILRTVERPSAESHFGRTSVYHVHGFVVFSAEDFNDPRKNAPDARVLTEQDYFDFFNRPNSLFNSLLSKLTG
jgi:hypothetical protein